jgi:hypothetical protein
MTARDSPYLVPTLRISVCSPDASALGHRGERDLVPRALEEAVERGPQDPLGVGSGGLGTAAPAVGREAVLFLTARRSL